VLDTVLSRLPRPIRDRLYDHRELVKFAVVGGTTFIIDTGIFLGLKSTVLESKPVTAKVISTLVATIVSYILNREWSFRTRGGRVRHHEALLFFLVSGLGIVVTSMPLWISRYGLHLETPYISRMGQEVADFISAQIVGTLLAMAFRWWSFRRFVFPDAQARARATDEEIDLTAAELLGDVWPLVDEPDDILDSDGNVRRSRHVLDSDDTEDPLSTR
jgi:putative flippase GtrA